MDDNRHDALLQLCIAASNAGCKNVIVPVGKLSELIRDNAYLRRRLNEIDRQQPSGVVG
jgi:hypothetical protein